MCVNFILDLYIEALCRGFIYFAIFKGIACLNIQSSVRCN